MDAIDLSSNVWRCISPAATTKMRPRVHTNQYHCEHIPIALTHNWPFYTRIYIPTCLLFSPLCVVCILLSDLLPRLCHLLWPLLPLRASSCLATTRTPLTTHVCLLFFFYRTHRACRLWIRLSGSRASPSSVDPGRALRGGGDHHLLLSNVSAL